MSWNFRVLDDFGLDGTWTCGTQFVWFSVSCHKLCMSFHFLLHDMSMGFMRRNHCDLFCSFVKSCACIGSWIWIEFAVCHKFALFLSETLEFGRSHITYQDVRHASWG